MDELTTTRASLAGAGRWGPVQRSVRDGGLHSTFAPVWSIAVAGVSATTLSSSEWCAGDAIHDERSVRSPASFTSIDPSWFEDSKTNAELEMCAVASSHQSRHRHVSQSRMDSRAARLLSGSTNYTSTTASLPFENSLNWCHRSNRKGGLDVTMSNSTVAKRCDGRVPRAGTLRGSNSPISFAFAKMLVPHQFFPLNSRALVRRAAVSNKSTSEAVGDVQPLSRRASLFNKVLRIWQKGQRSSPQLVRISSDLPSGSSLAVMAVKGDALIHGPSLVARPVGSEWRTRRPYQGNIQTN